MPDVWPHHHAWRQLSACDGIPAPRGPKAQTPNIEALGVTMFWLSLLGLGLCALLLLSGLIRCIYYGIRVILDQPK
jgi:hypothetical protein